MKKSAIVLMSFLMITASALEPLAGADDPVPWPFANHCPFPWQEISGLWKVIEPRGGPTDFFEFTTEGVTRRGSRIVEIRRFSSSLKAIATGRGISPAGQRIVRFAMVNLEPKASQEASYTVFVGNYVEKSKLSCDKDRVFTILTIRPYLEENPAANVLDRHFIIEKSNERHSDEQDRPEEASGP
ncbi:MAG: hypothetical protein IPL83_18245 [Bdellovibrionales bacterium]|nr:hypothetical protein [Bdellovibrionales bacterium]